MLDPSIPRHRIENAIEALLALLDASEPDPDLESQGDDEPSLGWPTNAAGGIGFDCTDAELDEAEFGIGDLDGLVEQAPGMWWGVTV